MTRHMSFRGIAEDLGARIRSGEYPPAAKLPTLQGLAVLYGVSVSTAQRAVLLLQERGLVQGESGRGVFVTGDPDSD